MLKNIEGIRSLSLSLSLSEHRSLESKVWIEMHTQNHSNTMNTPQNENSNFYYQHLPLKVS